MKKYCLFICMFLLCAASFAQRKRTSGTNVKIGAYYFGGWASMTNTLLTPALRDSFSDRKPVWGWVSSSPEIMKTQIDLAADAGLSFFSFDWYYAGAKSYENESLNKDLALYLAAPNKKRLQFSVFVVNHSGFLIGSKEWPALTSIWIKLFKDKGYLKVNGKPYLSFFDLNGLIRGFGSVEAVHSALDSVRSVAIQNGLKGVTFALCVSPEPTAVAKAKSCGFDVFTAYNYPTVGFRGKQTNSIDSLTDQNEVIWNRFKQWGVPYIPVSTLNWDPRPWRRGKQDARYYTGYSSESIYKSIKRLQNWVNNNPNYTAKDKIAIVYAWNEFGEGGYLTPTKNFNPLIGVKKALLNQ